MSTINASVYRTTRFELRTIRQEANAFALVCSERAVPPVVVPGFGVNRVVARRTPELDVHESRFTDDEMRQVHAVLEMLERKFAEVFEGWEAAPERVGEAIEEATKAEKRLAAAKAELAKVEAETARKRAEKP